MARKGMNLKEFNDVMKRCGSLTQVRYVEPTIHPKIKEVVAFNIYTDNEIKTFTVTNNPDLDFDLNKTVNDFLDNLV